MPVLPLVASTMDMPGFNTPRSSASHTMAAPIRHFTENDGLRPSTLARIVARLPGSMRLMRTSGVRPMDLVLSSKIGMLHLVEPHFGTYGWRLSFLQKRAGNTPTLLCGPAGPL